MTVGAREFRGIGKSRQETEFRPGDFVLVVDPFRFEYFSTEVAQ